MPLNPSTLNETSMFQSAPDREAGRCSALIGSQTMWISFNPRPTVRPGDAS